MNEYRPSEWGFSPLKSKFYMQDMSTKDLYFFDAIRRVEHHQELVITKHPVQGGAAITDHAYLNPAKVVLEISMSDAVAMYNAGEYTGDTSKSVAAYSKFLMLQKNRVFLQLVTRIRKYNNMLISSISPIEDPTTGYSLNATIAFDEILMGNISTLKVSAKSMTDVITQGGSLQPEDLTAGTIQSLDQIKYNPASGGAAF